MLIELATLSLLYGYETATWRKHQELEKSHTSDALCVATYETGERAPTDCANTYWITFRPRQTRKQYHDLPRKGQGRVRYEVNAELEGFRKGDIVRVKGKWVKQINSIYSTGYLAFARVRGEPNTARPKDCQLLERGRMVVWTQAQ